MAPTTRTGVYIFFKIRNLKVKYQIVIDVYFT